MAVEAEMEALSSPVQWVVCDDHSEQWTGLGGLCDEAGHCIHCECVCVRGGGGDLHP